MTLCIISVYNIICKAVFAFSFEKYITCFSYIRKYEMRFLLFFMKKHTFVSYL